MKMPHEGYGEDRAGKIPTCWVCDRPIENLAELRQTSRGHPLCAECAKTIDDRVASHIAGLSPALQAILKEGAPNAHL